MVGMLEVVVKKGMVGVVDEEASHVIKYPYCVRVAEQVVPAGQKPEARVYFSPFLR